jgi:hypothetical protein
LDKFLSPAATTGANDGVKRRDLITEISTFWKNSCSKIAPVSPSCIPIRLFIKKKSTLIITQTY